jgi:hypothetical protein
MIRRHRSKLLMLFGAFALSLSVPAAHAQRVAVYDFSTQQPKDRIRKPKAFPPNGRCGGVLNDPSLAILLKALDKTGYALGDEVRFTIEVRNTGTLPQRFPITPNLADVEPSDPTESYTYQPAEIWLSLLKTTDAAKDGGDQLRLSTLLLTLYGSKDRPGTEVELKPGEWIEFQGRAKLEDTSTSGKQFSADVGVFSTIKVVTKKIAEMSASAFSWRGDDARFDGRTQYEYVSCHGYEMSGARGLGVSQHVDLLPATAPN